MTTDTYARLEIEAEGSDGSRLRIGMVYIGRKRRNLYLENLLFSLTDTRKQQCDSVVMQGIPSMLRCRVATACVGKDLGIVSVNNAFYRML